MHFLILSLDLCLQAFSSSLYPLLNQSYLIRVVANPAKIESMSTWPRPQTPKALRGFLGLTAFYKRFTKDYGSQPLTELLKKDAFRWSEAAELAFHRLKTLMNTTQFWPYQITTKPSCLDDDSGKGVGAVLIQDGHPI